MRVTCKKLECVKHLQMPDKNGYGQGMSDAFKRKSFYGKGDP